MELKKNRYTLFLLSAKADNHVKIDTVPEDRMQIVHFLQ